MKKVIAFTIVVALVLAAVSGCEDKPKGGPKGGSVGKGESFKIDVPTFDVKVKQGETQSVTIELERGESFKQDVKLKIESAKGISVEPGKILVKASDKPEVALTITVPKDAALGNYKVTVTGTPATGEPTSVKFKVKVVNVRTMNFKGKSKSQMTKRGKFEGRTSHFKKAIVTLKEGDKIDLFANV